MDLLNDINAVPVILGSGRIAFRTALDVYRRTGISPHVFSGSHSLLLRFFAHCHRIPENNTDIVCRALCDFASELDEAALPILISLPRAPLFGEEERRLIDSFYISSDPENSTET